MTHTTLRGRLGLAAVGLGLLAAACQRDDRPTPFENLNTAPLAVTIELSTGSAQPGQSIAVAIRAEAQSAQPLVGLQGQLRFDPARLSYLGQVGSGPFAITNERDAARGLLRVASLDPKGLAPRTATYLFRANAVDFMSGLKYELEGAAARDLSRFTRVSIASQPVVAADLSVSGEARHLDLDAWRQIFAPSSVAFKSPGQYVANLKYGDANLDGTVDIVNDAFYVANVSVGNNELIVGTDAPSRDAVVAANVDPANSPGLGEASDAIPPGQEADGGRIIAIFDAAAIANAAVGNPTPIAGNVIPGRGPVQIPSTRRTLTAGTYTGNLHFFADTVYQLDGIVRIGGNGPSSAGTTDSEAVLTIDAGTRIEGNSALVSALFIQRNGKILANGTLLQPVVMSCTAATKTKGCWGGLVIAGNAHINTANAALGTSPAGLRGSAGGCIQNQGEGGAPVYGGCDDNDNSGVLHYVRAEYPGFILSPNNELNGITLYSVGRGTTIDHIQVHAGLDDGIELFGGTANLKNIYLTANEDDSFDNDFGWSGDAQFIIAQHDSLDSDKGNEVDNSANAPDFNNSPRTAANIFNFTFVGKRFRNSTSGVAGNNSNEAIHQRRGAHETHRNWIIYSAHRAMNLDDVETCTDNGDGTGTYSFRNSLIAETDTLGNPDTDPTCPAGFLSAGAPAFTGTNLEAAYIQDPANSNVVLTPGSAASVGLFRNALDTKLPDFRPVGSAATTGAAPAPAGHPFLQTVNYLGAVAPTGVPWYSGWTIGWQSTVP